MWWCGESQLLALRSSFFPTPDTVPYCKGPHVHVCGPLCLHPNSVHSLLQTATPWPPVRCRDVWTGSLVYPWVGNPGKRSMWALEVGFGSFGQGILECGPEGDWVCTEEAWLPHSMAHRWKSTRVEPSKAQRPGQGSPIQWCFCFICKLPRGRAGVSLICWGIPNA